MRPFARAPHVELPEWLLDEPDKVAHRDYSTGFYYPEHKVTQNTDRSAYFRSWLVVGEVLSWSADEDGRVTLMSRNKIEPGQQVEFLLPGERPLVFTVPETGLRDADGAPVPAINNPAHVFSMPCPHQVPSTPPSARAPKGHPSKPNNLPLRPRLTGGGHENHEHRPHPRKNALCLNTAKKSSISNSISSTDKAGRPIPVTIPIALAPGIKVVYTTRLGGLSTGDYGNLNLGGKSGDEPEAVLSNRIALAEAVQARLSLVSQVHSGVAVDVDDSFVINNPPSASTCPAHMVRLTLRTSSRRTARSPHNPASP